MHTYSAAVEADPNAAVACHTRGELLDKLGKPEDALADFARCAGWILVVRRARLPTLAARLLSTNVTAHISHSQVRLVAITRPYWWNL